MNQLDSEQKSRRAQLSSLGTIAKIGPDQEQHQETSTEHMSPRNRIAEEPSGGTQRFGSKTR
jgi:hypothetical protein